MRNQSLVGQVREGWRRTGYGDKRQRERQRDIRQTSSISLGIGLDSIRWSRLASAAAAAAAAAAATGANYDGLGLEWAWHGIGTGIQRRERKRGGQQTEVSRGDAYNGEPCRERRDKKGQKRQKGENGGNMGKMVGQISGIDSSNQRALQFAGRPQLDPGSKRLGSFLGVATSHFLRQSVDTHSTSGGTCTCCGGMTRQRRLQAKGETNYCRTLASAARAQEVHKGIMDMPVS